LIKLGESNVSGNPDTKSIGISINNLTAVVQAHDGTTLSTSATVKTLAGASDTTHFLLQSDGAGNLSVWVDGVFVLTMTGAPTTISPAGLFSIQAEVLNGADAVNQRWQISPVFIKSVL
jgi:hypothetical protein